MSTPAQPYVAPWATEFRRYSAQTFTLADSSGGGPVTPTFLGVFTVAEWPPSGGAVSQGQTALLADTSSGLTFAWLLEYRPDLDATYPWRQYNAATPAYSTAQTTGAYHDAGATGWQVASAHGSALNVTVPIAGAWVFESLGSVYSGVSSAARVGVSTTNSVAPAAGNYASSSGSGMTMLATTGIAFTLAKSATIYTWVYGSDASQYMGYSIGAYPTKLANA